MFAVVGISSDTLWWDVWGGVWGRVWVWRYMDVCVVECGDICELV